jgi:hypothetical protein
MYDVGDVVPLGLSVTDAAGSPANGGSVTLTIGLPDGTIAAPTVTNPPTATGEYTVDYTATMEGLHTVSWVVTGTNATAYRDVFNVREITDQLISLREAKKQLRLPLDTVDHDDDLRMFIAAAGRAVENHTGRVLVRRTISGERHRRVCGTLVLHRAPVISLTSVGTLDGNTTWTVGDLDVEPDTGIVSAFSGVRLRGNLSITYVAGSRVIAANHLLATRIITEHLWQTMRPFSSVANLPPGVLEDSLDARSGGLVGFAIPNRALELLGTPAPLAG